jgi:phytoene dehydrogenase-like protein
MSESWDTIVVGAGAGGLSAAAYLVKAGQRVLVLEKNPHAGGTAYVFTRKGFTFPMGPLGFSSPGVVRHTLSDLKQDEDLDFARVHYRMKAFDLSVSLSAPFIHIQEELSGIFPNEAEAIKTFFHDMAHIISGVRSPKQRENGSMPEPTRGISAREYIESLITDWRLCRILGSLGTREPYSSIPLLAAMWDLMGNEGIWYPKGGMGAFCNRLVRAVTGSDQHSGALAEIRLRIPVKQIRVKNGRAAGVTLGDGTTIEASNIVSNADFKATFLNLLDPNSMPERWVRAVARARQTGSVFQVCLGLETSKLDVSAFSQESRLIYRRGSHLNEIQEPDWSAGEVDPKVLAGQELEISLVSREDPMLAPPNGSVVVIRTEADHTHFMKYRPTMGGRMSSYKEYKTRLAEGLIHETSRLLPGLEQAIQVMDVATPLTFEDQGGRSQGAVAGWSWDYEDNRDYRPLELIQTPIRGLYMVGYQAYSALFMGGVPTAIESGRRVAELLLVGAGPSEEVRIPVSD